MYPRLLFVLVLAVLAGAALLAGWPGGEVSHAPPERGMVLGLFSRDAPAATGSALDELEGIGVDSISIVIPWVIRDVRSSAMAPSEAMTPSDASLQDAIDAAHRRGMSVLLMPILYVEHMGEGEWRGTIDPDGWKGWFAAYEEFILHYARLAGRLDVEYFSVGSELCSTERRRADWVRIIDRVRAVYGGAVTYSANWDHLEISFGDRLDFLGMNAYFRIARTPEAGVEEMVRSWKPIRSDLDAWRARWGDKRILITEVGYPSRRGAGIDPWNYAASGKPAPEEQKRCYQAFREVWGGDPALQGVYFYMWWGEGGPDDTDYTPRNKPAETVLRDWYLGGAR